MLPLGIPLPEWRNEPGEHFPPPDLKLSGTDTICNPGSSFPSCFNLCNFLEKSPHWIISSKNTQFRFRGVGVVSPGLMILVEAPEDKEEGRKIFWEFLQPRLSNVTIKSVNVDIREPTIGHPYFYSEELDVVNEEDQSLSLQKIMYCNGFIETSIYDSHSVMPINNLAIEEKKSHCFRKVSWKTRISAKQKSWNLNNCVLLVITLAFH